MLSPDQIKKLEKLAKVGDVGIADELNVLEGKIEALEEIVPQLREAKDGETGPMGPQGEKGEPGESIVGPMGPAGRDGKDGKDGKDGINGRDGKDGRDGIDGKDGTDGFVDEATVAYLEEEVKKAKLDREAYDRALGIVDQRTSFLINKVNNLPTSSGVTSVVAGTNVTVDNTDPKNPVVSATEAWGGIIGTLSDQTDLQTALNAKANTSHSHAISDTTGLQTALDAKVSKAGDTMTGALTLANQADAIKTGDYTMAFKSYKTNGAGAVAFHFDTVGNIFDATARPFKFSMAGAEQMWLGSSMGAFGGTSNTVTAGYAFGQANTNSAPYTTTFGYGNVSSGNGGVAAGLSNIAGALYSVALGFSNNVTASAMFSAAIGAFNTMNGSGAILGSSNTIITGGSGAYLLGQSLTAGAANVAMLGKSLYCGGMNGTVLGAGASSGRMTQANGFAVYTGSDVPLLFSDKDKYTTLNNARIGIAYHTSVGADMITNGTFTGSATGWTLTTGWGYASNTVLHNADGTGALTQALTGLTVGAVYVLQYTISAYTVGTVTPSMATAGFTFNNRAANGTYYELFIPTSTTDTLTFTPTSTARFTIDTISLKRVTGGNLSVAGTSYLNAVNLLDSNITLGTTTGTKIGTATTEKLAFWGLTPIAQPTTAVAAATFVANTSGIVDDTATYDGYTLGQVVKALRNSGLLA